MTTPNTLNLPAPAPVLLVPAPSAAHTYTCSDCIETTRATEVHDIGDGDVVAYCARCAHTYRKFALRVWPAQSAHHRGVLVTL